MIKGIEFDEKNITKLFYDVASIEIGDNVEFSFEKAEQIREDHEYGGIRISAIANYFSLKLAIKFDFSTGDIVTPEPITYSYKPLLDDVTIVIKTYNPETILAEKIQTILWRGTATTRMRDYYDVWLFAKIYKESINTELFYKALINTARNRDSLNVLDDWTEKLNRFVVDENLIDQWERFKNKKEYTEDIDFADVFSEIKKLMKYFDKYKGT